MAFEELKILSHHGNQFVPDLKTVELTSLFRGRPEISADILEEEAIAVELLCPSKAIARNPFTIDLGKCIFCKECALFLPEKIKFTNDYKIAGNSLESLLIQAGENKPITLDNTKIRPEIRNLFKHSLKLRQVSAAGDNSNEMELNASNNVNFDMGRYGIEWVASPRHADGIVITGPISENMSEALQICYDAMPTPKIIILVGADAISGGMFAESKAINRTFIDNNFIDLYVPGNPVHPLTFINGLLSLLGK